MEENKDLKWIKKHYSEKLAHICRELFPTLLETTGLLPKILNDNFAKSSRLGDDIESQHKLDDFKSFIYSFVDVENNNALNVNKTPEELMSEAGYILYPECRTEEDIQRFRHYYFSGEETPVYSGGNPKRCTGEELCTFNGGRLNSCRVWFAVKKEVVEDEHAIKRSITPKRQDNYGTSVISIQFSRSGMATLSIKNRYNHSVNQPDATFSNNLDNIIIGLTEAFNRTYNLNLQNQKQPLEIEGYVKANDGKYYRYNFEKYNIYYCENNVIIDNFEVKQLDPRYVLMDCYIVDLSTNTITMYDKSLKDCFIETLGKIEKITLERDDEKNKVIRVQVKNGEDILITVNKYGQIIKLYNSNVKTCGNSFMEYNNSLISLSLPNLKSCGDSFLFENQCLSTITLPNLKSCGISFMAKNNTITSLSLPNLVQCGDFFIYYNTSLTTLSLPNLKICDSRFISDNEKLTTVFLPNLKSCGDNFLSNNNALITLSLPKLVSCESFFLRNNKTLKTLNVPRLKKFGYSFLENNALVRNNVLKRLPNNSEIIK